MIVHRYYNDLQVSVPATAYTLEGFRAWARSEAFPQRGNITFVQGEILIDMSPEKLSSHNQVKAEVSGVIGPLVKALDLGQYYPDGLWITNDDAALSTEPDGTFAAWETLESGNLQLIANPDEDDGLEMRGTPDWVLEVVSTSSVRKDTELLVASYHQAGIPEYWLVDARGEDLAFTILQHEPEGYKVAEPVDGWLVSRVFGREFRLDRSRDRVGSWRYTLHVREKE